MHIRLESLGIVQFGHIGHQQGVPRDVIRWSVDWWCPPVARCGIVLS